ncbi:hypothetical protein BOTBODRAFT_26796 [Botryobasidium botryosum FD-172 SS1]|uniref:Uncharacterized protein n=1 Tax=Botryobasidium botryosum (strain FD-172 SS1) TaxID=930990 RepID=A0A067MYF9_BOTB1|nr:hypothetical protein BOTBODRAFT_26796 [Botryobasidium botryosum FD-172 SS1]
MSSSSPSVSTTTATGTSPAQTSSGSNNSGGGGASNSLYLFTFLTTLLLLLAVSCAIVLRSWIIRRRFRRRIEEAIAAGVLLPEQIAAFGGTGQGRHRNFGERPKLWEVSIRTGEGKTHVTSDWADIMPVAANIIPAPSSTEAPPPADQSPPPIPPPPVAVAPPRSYHLFSRPRASPPAQVPPITTPSASTQQNSTDTPGFRHIFSRSRRPTTPILPIVNPASPSSPQQMQLQPIPSTIEQNPAAAAPGSSLQVTVLIALPTPHRPPPAQTTLKGKDKSMEYDEDEDVEELPEVVLGTTEVPWTAPASNPVAGPSGPAADTLERPSTAQRNAELPSTHPYA